MLLSAVFLRDMPPAFFSQGLLLSGLLPLIIVTPACFFLMLSLRRLYRTNQTLRRAADRDGLTNLANRAAFHRAGKAAFLKARTDNENLSLIMIDIDYFKTINDRWGHLAGDRALQHVAAVLSRFSRDSDLLARWGGEEFALVLKQADLEAAKKVADRLCEELANEPFVWDTKSIQLTMSAGVSQMHSNDLVLEDVVFRADKALYDAKSSGRNQVFAPIYHPQDDNTGAQPDVVRWSQIPETSGTS